MMPPRNAALIVDILLTALTVLEQQGVTYTVHQGTLLGAARLGGLLPWDIDADIAILGETPASASEKLTAPLAEHDLAFIFSPEACYYTIRPFTRLGNKSFLGFPLVEVILATATSDEAGGVWYDRHSPHRMFAPGELLPLRRYSWYGSYVYGPAQADAVLDRLYSSAGNAHALQGFRRAALDDSTATFWHQMRPLEGNSNIAAIAARSKTRRLGKRMIAVAPWYFANGAYNAVTETARTLAGGR